MSCDRVLEIARQYQVDKNTAQAEVNCLTRKLADTTNDNNTNDNNDNFRQPKRRRVRHKSPSVDTDDADTHINRTEEQFVYQAGHKFFLLHAPWIRSGDSLFETGIDRNYNVAERFENDKSRDQGQLKEIIDLLQEKFQAQSLHQRWLRWQVSSIHVLQCCFCAYFARSSF
jgi:hypothetical protein